MDRRNEGQKIDGGRRRHQQGRSSKSCHAHEQTSRNRHVIIDTQTAITNFNAGKYDSHNVFLIVKEPETLIKLVDGGVKIPKVNIGIMFDGPDKTTVKKMVSVNQKEINDFKELQKRGVPVTFRFVPSDPDEPFEKYIKD